MDWIEANRGLVGWSWALVAAGLTVLWLKVVPEKAADVDTLRRLVIRYAHPACWAFFSIAGAAYALGAAPWLVRGLSAAALVAYVGFVVALVT